jgi:hypothetical protein
MPKLERDDRPLEALMRNICGYFPLEPDLVHNV